MFNTHKVPYGKIQKRAGNYYMIPQINSVGIKDFCRNLIFGGRSDEKNYILNK